jgi:hypothetical protein
MHAAFDELARYWENLDTPGYPTRSTPEDLERADSEMERSMVQRDLDFQQELEELYQWWQKYLTTDNWEIVTGADAAQHLPSNLEGTDTADNPDFQKADRAARNAMAADRELERQEQEMFHRLVDIRQYLWY